MCGIAAIFNYGRSQPTGLDEILRVRDAMFSRGPDGCGHWTSRDQRARLAHRRLSIIDPSLAGAQPMHTRDSSLVITFNGEIYNYRELRSKLEAQGCAFQSNGDTEVLLHLYASEGPGMVKRLRGMFAFALWDQHRKGLLLARDPFGIKPLYYSDNGATLRAASQVRALLAGDGIDTSPEPAGHVGFFLWGHVPSPHTLYRGIKSLPAGTTLWVDQDGTKTQTTFCDTTNVLAAAETASSSHVQADRVTNSQAHPTPACDSATSGNGLSWALKNTVCHHLLADVPVGVFLSSGLDSTSIAALAAGQCGSLRTITVGFEEYKGTLQDETPLAAEIARRLGTQHHTVWITRGDFHVHRDHLFDAMDQPSIDGVNTYFVSLAAASASLKVALSGVGGDELFGGYAGFEEIPQAVRRLALFRQCPPLGKALRILSDPILKRMTSPKYAGLFEYGGTYSGAYLLRRGLFMPWELPRLLEPELVRAGWEELQPLLRLEETLSRLRSPRLKVSCLESRWYMQDRLLRDADWAGMAHSVEIRVPFADAEFLRQVAPLCVNGSPPTKLDLAQACGSELPALLLQRPKTGFSVPLRQWLLSRQPGAEGRRADSGHDARVWAKYVYSQFVKSYGRSWG